MTDISSSHFHLVISYGVYLGILFYTAVTMNSVTTLKNELGDYQLLLWN